MSGSFSDRFGYRAPQAEITIREDAPREIREAIVMLGFRAELGPNAMRDAICEVLLTRPDPSNWSASNVEGEVHRLAAVAPWFKIYDIAEHLWKIIARNDYSGLNAKSYEAGLNAKFYELGIGWQIDNGIIKARGSEAFELATKDAADSMRNAGSATAANELHEALTDISRRPKADITGAIQHAMAALECVARQVSGSKQTLGPIINQLVIPDPLKIALHKLWGFSSEQGRHIQEGREPSFEEAELIVTVASAVSVYLLRPKNAA